MHRPTHASTHILLAVLASTTRLLLHDTRQHRERVSNRASTLMLHPNQHNRRLNLPNPILPPAAHRPSLPPLHQSVERDRALRNGLLPDDEHGVRRGEQQRLPDVRPVPHPDGVDHVCHGVRGHADDYADYGCYADFLRKSRG
ncbi:hypothetical protein F4825DRAFT_86086 [Nemania diffusa]|nr:hypothetical protein F4825DRAFT_86086 [Nemania diffusa]